MGLVNTKIAKTYTKVDLFNSRLLIVDSRSSSETLAEYVSRIRGEKNFSVEKVAERSGGAISQAYVNKIENNGVKNVSPEKLLALAKGLGVTQEEIFAVVRGKNPNTDAVLDERFVQAGLKFKQVKEDKRRNAEALFEAFERELERVSSE